MRSRPHPSNALRASRRLLALVALAGAVIVSGCGSEDKDADDKAASNPVAERIAYAKQVTASDFPPAGGHTLEEIAGELEPGINIGLAVSELVPGTNRLAFGVIDASNKFVYGKSAAYVAEDRGAVARGPFPAPADSLLVDKPFRSKQSTTEDDITAAIYQTEVSFPRAGKYTVLVVNQTADSQLRAGIAEVQVKGSGRIPGPGERAPSIETPTLKSVGGDFSKIETRTPPDEMHEYSFRDVVGRRPVALLFATPALCESRTCGPVTDIMNQLKQTYGNRMAFIHQEVFVGNDPSKGYRPQLRAFNLQSEPWLFTFDRDGRVAARLEGSFGMDAARRAVEAAL